MVSSLPRLNNIIPMIWRYWIPKANVMLMVKSLLWYSSTRWCRMSMKGYWLHQPCIHLYPLFGRANSMSWNHLRCWLWVVEVVVLQVSLMVLLSYPINHRFTPCKYWKSMDMCHQSSWRSWFEPFWVWDTSFFNQCRLVWRTSI